MKYIQILILWFANIVAYGQVTPTLITLNTDRPFYFNGQKILISYHLADFANRLEKKTELLYVTILDSNSQPIENVKNLSKHGSGEITISLPDDIKSGLYQIVAFTNYNRFFGASSFVRMNIPIYNLADNISKASSKPEPLKVQFFPEGGHLMDGVSNRVVCKVSDEYKNSEANLFEGNKIITSFTLSNEGFGNFYFKPDGKKSYLIKFNLDSTHVTFPLPTVESDGVAFSLTQRNQALQVILKTADHSLRNDSIHLVGYASNIKVYESNGILNKGFLYTEIATERLPPGTINFFALNRNQDVIAKRSVFNGFQNIPVDITLKNQLITTKTKAEFSISSPTNLSSIVNVKIIPTSWFELQSHNILDYLGLRGNIEYKFIKTPLSSSDYKLIDDILITKSVESEIPDDRLSNKQFIHENTLYLRGNFVDSKPLPDSTILYFFVPEVNVIYQAKIDTSGFFEFPLLFEFYGDQQIPFYPFTENHEYENPKIISLEENVTYSGKNKGLPWTDIHENAKRNFMTQNKVAEVFNFYEGPKQPNKTHTPFDINNLIPIPDTEYYMEDYILFKNMEEVIKEILNGVMLRTKKGKYTLRMFSEDLQVVYKESPFIFIDNEPTKDIERLLNLNPENIERIRLISKYEKLRQLGPFGAGGLIIIELKPNSKSVSSFNNNLTFKAAGLSNKNANVRNVPKPNIPDMREVLLWKPNQVMKSGAPLNLSFTTSDRPGNYVIVVELISEDGKIGYTTKKFTVGFKGANQSGKPNQE